MFAGPSLDQPHNESFRSTGMICYWITLVRPLQQRLRDRQPSALRGLQVDDEGEFGRLMNGEISGLCAFEDLVDVVGGNRVMCA
jgi:hypothetical protein